MGILIIPKRASIGRLLVDANVREQHTFSASKTSRPIEASAPMSDHVQLSLPRLVIDGVVGLATPSPSGLAAMAGIAGLIPLTGPAHLLAATVLQEIWEGREPVSVYTSLGEYQNMVMLSLVFQRDRATRRSLPFTCEFERDGRINLLGDVDVSGPNAGLLSGFADLGDLGLIP